MHDLNVSQSDLLRSDYRAMKAECERLQHKRRRLVKWGLLGPVFGMAVGACGMVYVQTSMPPPVVVEIERSSAPADPSRVQAALVKLTTVNRAMLAQLEQRERFTVRP